MDFESQVLQFIKNNKLIHSGDSLVVGFSGGADSMSLASVLAAKRHELGIRLHALHFNHRARPGALRDERFVRLWCKRLDIPLTVGRRRGKIKPLSEEEARDLRFKFLIKQARRLKVQAVALAHTKDDLAETVLMRLLRGSGLYGIKGIWPRRIMQNVVFIRPLMGVGRGAIEEYLKARRIPFCTDKTNKQTIFLRNKIRLKLLPLLAQEYNPQIIKVLTSLSLSASDDYDYLSWHAQKAFKKHVKFFPKRAIVSLHQLKAMHPAIRRLVIRQMIESLGLDPSTLAFASIKGIERCLEAGAVGPVYLPHLKVQKIKNFLELKHAYKI